MLFGKTYRKDVRKERKYTSIKLNFLKNNYGGKKNEEKKAG
jgi:hypothetical protein